MPDQPDDDIPLGRRQAIFRALVEAQDGGMAAAATRAEAVRRFAITREQLRAIEREGLTRKWPPL
jgi:hypothetical protein